MSKLTAVHAREIAWAEANYKTAKRNLEAADAERKKVRAKHIGRFTLGIEQQAGGYRIRVRRVKTGASFSISQFLEKNKLTKAMAAFYSPGGERDDWRVEALPRKDEKRS